MTFSARRCGTCKHFSPANAGQQFPECRRLPIHTEPLLLGVGPRTSQHPNGTPIIHLDTRYAVPPAGADTPPCGEWCSRIEIAHDLGEMETFPIPGNGGEH